jgi:tetratricopeptide (TPR) repeat protein
MTSSSPIASRLALLYEQWETFATDREARALRWLIRDDERRMLEALLALEDDEHGQLAVLFFVLDTPFERRPYGHELRHNLEQQLAAMGEDFAAAARSPSGDTSEAMVSDIGLLMQTCSGLVRHIDDAVEMIALVLWPKAVGEPKAFAEWLHRAARVVPPRVRFVVVDRVEAPLLDSLNGPHVRSVTADLDMQGALEELAADAPGRASAGGRFREAFVAMSTALARGELDVAREQADAALEIAREAGFDHLEAAVPFALAGGLFGFGGDVVGAIEQFQKAEQHAAAAPDSDWGPTLRGKAQLGLAGVLFGAEAWARAGEAYESAGALAGERQDSVTEVDALRMAAWSWERGGELEQAWATGLVGLGVAEEMTEEALERSTVPWLGELLLRLNADGARFEAEREHVALRLAQLLGSGWRR